LKKNSKISSRGLLDCAQIWYEVWPYDIGSTAKVKGQGSKVNVTS